MALRQGETGTDSINREMSALEDRVAIGDPVTVATLPPAADHPQQLRYVTDGNAGAPCLAFSDGASWLRIVLGAAVATA